MKFFRTRLMETLGFEVVLSVICAMLFYFNILEQTVKICSLVMLVSGIANAVRLVFDLRIYRRHSGVRRNIYYKTNFTVVLIITVLTLVFAGFNIEPLFTWLFFPFKFLNICFGAPKIISALALNAVFAIITVCIPVLVKPKRRRQEKSVKILQENASDAAEQ